MSSEEGRRIPLRPAPENSPPTSVRVQRIIADRQGSGWPFEDWSVDANQADDETAAHVKGTWPGLDLPSELHRQVAALLLANSSVDRAGRRVSWWPQQRLAAKLGITPRHLRRIIADLREPGSDPRHPNVKPAGLRLGLIKVEPTSYRDRETGRHRLGGNVYVLLTATGQRDMPAEPVSAAQVKGPSPVMSLVNKETPASEERKVSSSTVSSPVPLGLRYHGRSLTGSLADFRAAVDQLDRETCWNGDRCQPTHRCRRHTRRREKRSA